MGQSVTSMALWQHPGTGEQRIYFNAGQDAKVWVSNMDLDDFRIHYAGTIGDFGCYGDHCATCSDAAYNVVCAVLDVPPLGNAIPDNFGEYVELLGAG